MSLTEVERILLLRRLALARRRASPGARAGSLALAALLGVPMALGGAGLLAASAVYVALAGELQTGLERMQDRDSQEMAQTTRIYDRHGILLRERWEEGRHTYVPLAEIPLAVREATIAVEDKTFYANPGIDVTGIMRAIVGELTNRPGLGGGSTITQQHARIVSFSTEERFRRSYTRKAKEIILALILNRQHDKDQILEWYLNEIYYGNLAYGIEAAARTMFDKPAKDLDLAESALLVGLPQAPRDLDPLNPDPDVQDLVRARQRVVLDLMVDNDFISRAQADAAARQRLAYRDVDQDIFLAPHFVVWVEDVLEYLVGAERLSRGGLEVTTTLDLGLQDMGQRIVLEQVEARRENQRMSNAALVAMEPRTGQVLAMVGSADYWDDEIDGRVNVVLRERQPGSSIKPITYLTALERGMPTSSLLWDTPMEVPLGGGEVYEPQNYDEKFHGPVRLRAALANSYNIPALKLLRDIPPVGRQAEPELYAEYLDALQPNYATADEARQAPDAFAGVELAIATAHRMGIQGLNGYPWDYGLSLTLGGGEVTLLDLTTAFGTIANAGGLVRPHPILRVTDAAGDVLYDLTSDEEALTPVPAVDASAAYIVTAILSDNAARTPAFGAASPLSLGIPAAAKTGTTNDFRDNWTVGFTPYLVAGVWSGNNDNSPMVHSSGVTGAAPIWNEFMRGAVYDEDRREVLRESRRAFDLTFSSEFARPKEIVEAPICRLASLANLSAGCPELEPELFTEEMIDRRTDDATPALPDGGAGPPEVWTTMPVVVLPMPPPPEELVRAAQEEGVPVPWPTAHLCLPGGPGLGLEQAQPAAVLPLPVDEDERASVLEWAAENGWAALEPVDVCTPEMAAAAMPPGSLPQGYTLGAPLLGGPGALPSAAQARYQLNIAPGTVVTAATALTGTVVYDPGQVEYFKVELGHGREPTSWTTIGTTHQGQIADGFLESLDAGALPPGDYVVRLVLVKNDGNFLATPHSVPIRIGRQPTGASP